MAVMLCAGATVTSAAPWLGLVKTGTTTQTNDTIFVGTSIFDVDVRFDSGGNPVSTLQYWFYTSPSNTVSFGSTPIMTLSNPFVSTDIQYSPNAGSTITNFSWTEWFKQGTGDYGAFTNNIATYEINTSSLTAGVYVISFGARPGTDDEDVAWSTGEIQSNGFAPAGSFVLDIINVPEPATWTLMVAGGMVAGWKIRRRRTQR